MFLLMQPLITIALWGWKHTLLGQVLFCFILFFYMLQHLDVLLLVRSPTLNTVYEVQPQQSWVQRDHHFPRTDSHIISDTSLGAIDLLGHPSTPVAPIQPAIGQYSQAPFCQASFHPPFFHLVVMHGLAVPQVQDTALSLAERQTVGLSIYVQPIQVPL